MELNMALRLKIIERFGTQERFSVASGIPEAVVSKIIRGLRQPTGAQKEVFLRLLGFQFEPGDLDGCGAVIADRG